MPKKVITLQRKDKPGTIVIDGGNYTHSNNWYCSVSARGPRGKREGSLHLSNQEMRQFFYEMQVVAAMPEVDRKHMLAFCRRLYFNMDKRFDIYITNCQEIMAAVDIFAKKYENKEYEPLGLP